MENNFNNLKKRASFADLAGAVKSNLIGIFMLCLSVALIVFLLRLVIASSFMGSPSFALLLVWAVAIAFCLYFPLKFLVRSWMK
jgi:hypothetical protein